MAVSASKDAEFYLKRGRLYADKGKLERAVAQYTKAIELYPDDQKAYRLRAEAYRAAGDLDRAFADINKAVELNIYDAQAFMLRGLIHKDRGETADYEDDFRVAVLLDGELVNDEKYGAEFARIKKADEEEEEALWNDLRAALIQAQSNAEPEQQEGWATLLNGALKAVDRLAARRKDIFSLNRAAKYLGMEECRDVRTALGYALNEALERLGDLAVFRRDMRRHVLALESSGEEKSGFSAALLRVSQSLEALKIEEVNDVLLKIRAENSIHALRYLQTRINTGGRKFTWEEANER